MSNEELKLMQVENLRSHLGIVSQEPVLFDTTISENIRYGDNSRVVSFEEVIQAAKDANIHDFVKGLPEVNATLTIRTV